MIREAFRAVNSVQHSIRLELTTRHDIMGERFGCLLLQTLGPWSFLVTLLASQLKLFVTLPCLVGVIYDPPLS